MKLGTSSSFGALELTCGAAIGFCNYHKQSIQFNQIHKCIVPNHSSFYANLDAIIQFNCAAII